MKKSPYRAKGESPRVTPIIPIANADGAELFGRDTAAQEWKSEQERLALAVLECLNRANGTKNSIGTLLRLIKESTGLGAVGIRLREGEDFPYFVHDGFSDDFLRTENTLSVRSDDGETCRNKDGSARLERTCGLVISGKTDPSNSLFTDGGSFWTNNALPLLDLAPDQDPRLNPRNRCIHEGFLSVALIPLRADREIIGLLQFNDRRPNRLTLGMVRFFEGLGASIGIAFARQRAEAALRFANAILATQQETAIDGILVVNRDGRILSANRRFAEMWGLSSEILESKSDERALQAVMGQVSAPDAFIREVKRLYEFRDEKSRDDVLLKDGKVFDRYSSPMFGAQGEYYGRVWYFRDITENRKAIDAAQASEKALRELSDAKSEFVANASHELRTPLAIIRQFAFLLDSGIVGPLVPRQKECTTAALRNCDRLTELINRMLDLSRIEAGKTHIEPTRVDASVLLRQGYTDFLPKMETKKQRLALKLPDAVPAVSCDPQTIVSVITELLGNAHKFAPEGGLITLGCRPEGAFLTVYVEDNGPGVPDKDQKRIFEAFAQVARKDGPGPKGTGLGLTISREIVKLNGGALSMTSTPGKGSRFSFTLPFFGAEEQVARRILVADEDKKTAHWVTRGLKRSGLKLDVKVAANGLQSLVMAGTFHPHLVILNIYHPDSMGAGILKSLGRGAVGGNGKVLMISDDQRTLKTLARRGFHGYLVKPFSESQLLDKVMTLLEIQQSPTGNGHGGNHGGKQPIG